MAAIVMDGKALAAKVKERVRRQVEQLDIKPGLAVVLVGDDPASRVYVNGKKKTAESAEFTVRSTPCRGRPPRKSCWSWWPP